MWQLRNVLFMGERAPDSMVNANFAAGLNGNAALAVSISSVSLA
jgi:hypothetical protein